MSQDGVTIIKKKKRGGHGGGHGGGWKVAMADLMISMFALFLILWLLTMMDDEEGSQLIQYFQTGEVQAHTLSADALGNSISPIKLPQIATAHIDAEFDRIRDASLIEGEVDTHQELELFSRLIEDQVNELDGAGSVNVQITPQGLKIIISDSDKGPMFNRGGSSMTPYYQDLLLNLAPVFSRVENAIIVTGHTDASRFRGTSMTNWELSSNRANSARYFLNSGGVPRAQIFQVSGMAESAPLLPENPKSGQNRRIEIFLLTSDAQRQLSAVYRGLATPSEMSNDQVSMSKVQDSKEQARRAAAANQPPNDVSLRRRHEGMNPTL